MDIEKKIKKLESKQKDNEEVFGKIVDFLEMFSDNQMEVNKANANLWTDFTKSLKKYLRPILYLFLVLILREEIIDLFFWIGKFIMGLSDSWQQQLFQAFVGLGLLLFGIFIGKKSSSKESKKASKD